MRLALVFAAGCFDVFSQSAEIKHAACADCIDDSRQSVSLLQGSFVLQQRITNKDSLDFAVHSDASSTDSSSPPSDAAKDDESSFESVFFGHDSPQSACGSPWWSAESPGGSTPMWMNESRGEPEQLFSVGAKKLTWPLASHINVYKPTATSASSSIISDYLARSNPTVVRNLYAVHITAGSGTIAQPKTCKSWCTVNMTNNCSDVEIVLNRSDPTYDSVITIADAYADKQTYHGPIDIMSGLAFVDSTLVSDDKVKIHVTSKTQYLMEWMDVLGFPSDRTVEGNIWAKHAIIPAWSPHSPALQQLNWLQSRVWDATGPVDLANRNTLIVIKRSSRGASNHDTVVLPMAQQFAATHHLRLHVHDDKVLPSVREQLELFKGAKMVIAPHGAGEIFLIASAPGACVVEMLKPCFSCDDFARLSALTGLHYVDMVMGTSDAQYCGNASMADAPVDGTLLQESMDKCANALRL